jgi:hypothetical protein
MPARAERNTMNEEMKRAGFGWEHHLSGPREWVDKRVDELMAEYHPMGYGTRVVSNIEKDGMKRAVVWRANSCD